MRFSLLLCLLGVCAVWSQSGEDVASSEDECPTLAGLSSSLDPPLDVYVELTDMLGLNVDVISNGTVVYPPSENGLTPLASLPPSLSLHMYLHGRELSESLYYAVSVWSLNPTLAPSGCVTPRQGLLRPREDTAISVSVPCSDVGDVGVLLCITMATESFTLLNGTYKTFTIRPFLTCSVATTPGCSLREQQDVIPVEFCATREQTRELVEYGAGSWGLFITSFDQFETRGYCLVDVNADTGISDISRDAVAQNFPIPEAFSGLDLYMEASRHTTSDTFSYSFGAQVDNSTVLDDLYIELPVQPQGSSSGRLNIRVMMPCKNPGFTKVNIQLNTTGFRDEIIYERYHSALFYRNCTPDQSEYWTVNVQDTTVIVINSGPNLGVVVGVPVALVIVIIITVAVVTILIAVMVHFTRRHKRQSYELEQRVELDLLASSNAYVRTNFKDPFDFLDEYNIEYNYASLEVVDSLGEGAFGRVFKAKAPGIRRGDYTPTEFVAVKTLKGGSGSEVLESFRTEVKTCVRFEHPNVIRLVGVCTKTAQKCMIFEYMDQGGLGDLLRASDPASPEEDKEHALLTPDKFLQTVIQVAQGLCYLANLKFVHRDLATRNCLVDHNLNVKIADFGMSRETNAMDYYRIGSAKAYLPVRWMPPEALLYGKFTVKSDVWSFGVLMWEVYTYGRQPYGGMSNYEVIDKVKTGQFLECPDLCPAPIYEVMKSSWIRAPSRRPNMDNIVNRLGKLLVINDGADVNEGYMNMGFGTVASPDDLEEKQRVDVVLEEQERLDAKSNEDIINNLSKLD